MGISVRGFYGNDGFLNFAWKAASEGGGIESIGKTGGVDGDKLGLVTCLCLRNVATGCTSSMTPARQLSSSSSGWFSTRKEKHWRRLRIERSGMLMP